MSDGSHRLRKQPGNADHLGLGESDPAVCYPTAATVANSWDEDLAFEIGDALGRDAAARDVHELLGPGLNIKRSPLGGRNFEYFSEDPELTGRLAAAYVRGIQSTGVAATPKHFAANSQELRRLVSDSLVDERTLRELYPTGFEIVVREAQPWALMTAYNLVNGAYAHENAHLLTEILRDEWGFDGVVVSDWGADDPVASVAAGGTIEMPSPGFDSVRAIVAAVRDGSLDEADVDARVAELRRLVDRTTGRIDLRPLTEPQGHALARRAAAEGAVLLRNDAGTLPLARGTRIALVGAFAEHARYQGARSSIVNPIRLPRTAPILPLRPGLPEKATHDYKRNGTTTLFAALEVATGKVTDKCYDRHGKAEFLDFMKRVARAYPRQRLYVVVDNYHIHKHADIQEWLAKNPRISLHFTPTSGSLLNLVEVFFGIITRQAIRRGSFDSVKQLVDGLSAFITGWNDRCHPFTWTKAADEILPHATRQRDADARN